MTPGGGLVEGCIRRGMSTSYSADVDFRGRKLYSCDVVLFASEHRLVTVLFADVSGFTPMSEKLGGRSRIIGS